MSRFEKGGRCAGPAVSPSMSSESSSALSRIAASNASVSAGAADGVHDDRGPGTRVLRRPRPRRERRRDASRSVPRRRARRRAAVGEEGLVDDGAGLRLLSRPVRDAEDGLGCAGLVLGHLDVGAERVRDAGPALHVEQARQYAEPTFRRETKALTHGYGFRFPMTS